MKPLKALIIDDESKARMLLHTILEEYCSNIDIIGFSDTIDESVVLIKNLQPNIVFIDIEMKGETGFDLFKKMDVPENCFIIFVTAYKEYAIQALKQGAFDYILKPIDIDEIVGVIEKIQLKFSENDKKSSKEPAIEVTNKGEIHFLKLEDIVYLHGEGRYTTLFTNDNRSYVQTKNLGIFEKEIANEDFLRVHKSYIVNKKYVKAVYKNNGAILLSNGVEIMISKRNLSLF